MRKITVYATLGEAKVVLESAATTWGELQSDLKAKNVYYDNGVKAVIGETRNTIEVDDAVLPTGDFTLFLMQKKSKAGAESYKEMKERVKSLISENGEEAKKFFSVGSRNYTQLKTSELSNLLAKWDKSHNKKGKVVKEVKEEVVAETKNPIVAAIAIALNALNGIPEEETEKIVDDEAYDHIIDAIDSLNNANACLDVEYEEVESEEDKKARLAEEARKAEEAEAKRMMQDMRSKFRDVK